MVENDPISSILRRIVLDPATNKLLTFIFSTILVISGAQNIRKDWNLAPLLVIFGASLLYSVLALFVVVSKKQESISNCSILKKIFRGRTVFWHEIQATAAFTLAMAHISGIVLSGYTHEPLIQILFSAFNILLFTLEWYFASENSKSFVVEENPKLGHNCLDCILGGLHSFPLFFNIIRKACLIVSLVFVVTNSSFGQSVTYFIYCTSFAIAGSFALFVLQTSGSLENAISTKLVSGRKWHTFLMLAIVIHAFLAALTFSIVVDDREVYRSRKDYQPVYRNDYYNSGYYNNRDYYGRYRTGQYPTTTASPQYRTTWYYYYWTDYETFNAPIESPIAFVLSCVALLLSLLDLFARAIYSRSRRDNETTAPLHIQGGINKIEDLPISIASPHSFDNPNKQFYI